MWFIDQLYIELGYYWQVFTNYSETLLANYIYYMLMSFRLWNFKERFFGQKSLYLKEIILFRQNLGMILEEKGVSKIEFIKKIQIIFDV